MPAFSPTGQPGNRTDWLASPPARALFESEAGRIREVLAERPGQAWLWLSATAEPVPDGHGLRLSRRDDGWQGPIRCALPLPLANESVANVVLQHAVHGRRDAPLLAECARILVPGGRLWLFMLNPLSPYRWRWSGSGLSAAEPMPWRRRLRAAGLVPDPVSQGLGPRWRSEASSEPQQGPGLRAAWLLRAEKRTIPLTPVRARAALRIGEGVPAA